MGWRWVGGRVSLYLFTSRPMSDEEGSVLSMIRCRMIMTCCLFICHVAMEKDTMAHARGDCY